MRHEVRIDIVVIRRAVMFAPEAQNNLSRIYDWIAVEASPAVAAKYLERLEIFIRGFDLAAERGTRRDDLRAGLRIVGFEKRMTIAFSVMETSVVILRIFYGGRNWPDKLDG